MYIGALTPGSSKIFRQNVYEAVRIALGTSGAAGTPDNVRVSKAAEEYTIPRVKTLSVSMDRDTILKDPEFQAIIMKYQTGGTPATSGSGWGLMDSMVGFGIPNYAVYAVTAVVGALIINKLARGKKKGKRK